MATLDETADDVLKYIVGGIIRPIVTNPGMMFIIGIALSKKGTRRWVLRTLYLYGKEAALTTYRLGKGSIAIALEEMPAAMRTAIGSGLIAAAYVAVPTYLYYLHETQTRPVIQAQLDQAVFQDSLFDVVTVWWIRTRGVL